MADSASQVLLGSGLTVLSQPLMYVKVLVQVRAGGTGARRRCWDRDRDRGGVGAGPRGLPGTAGTGRASPRRLATSRCPPRWAATSSAARSTSCPASSPTVSERPREPGAAGEPSGFGGPRRGLTRVSPSQAHRQGRRESGTLQRPHPPALLQRHWHRGAQQSAAGTVPRAPGPEGLRLPVVPPDRVPFSPQRYQDAEQAEVRWRRLWW